jgi:outer membrane protein assembly factor BamB
MKTNFLFFLMAILGLSLFSCSTQPSAPDQWTQWRGPNRDGVSTEKNLLKTWPAEAPELAWFIDSLGDGFSSTSVYKELCFTLGKKDSSEILTSLDLNGNIVWQKVVGRSSQDKDWPQSRSTPTVYDDRVYSLTVRGDLVCSDYKTGKTIWELPVTDNFEGLPSDGIAESLLVFDDKVVVTPGGSKTTMVALDRLTGKTIWQSESLNDSTYFSSPVFVNSAAKKGIFMSTLYKAIMVDPESGKTLWKGNHISGMVPLPIGNQIYYGGDGQNTGTLTKWSEDLKEQSIVWKDTVPGNILGGGVLYKDKIIISGADRGLYCIESLTGQVLSKYDSIYYCNLLVADDHLYAYEDKVGRLGLFSLENGTIDLVSSFRVTKGTGPRIAHLAISNGLLFVRRGQVLMAYKIRKE